jgi:hypothetical protein
MANMRMNTSQDSLMGSHIVPLNRNEEIGHFPKHLGQRAPIIFVRRETENPDTVNAWA